MSDIYIVHYCHIECEPLKSITELPEEEAFKMANMLGSNNGTAFGRFKDFINYYPRRVKTEKWLYDWFIESGGKPKTEHPLYFVLEGSNYLNEWFDRGKIIKISLSEIDIKHISFTLGDSCANFKNENMTTPFLKNELYQMINKYDGNINELLKSIENEYHYKYIECQLWNNDYQSIEIFKNGLET
jgi:hypothetical protein